MKIQLLVTRPPRTNIPFYSNYYKNKKETIKDTFHKQGENK